MNAPPEPTSSLIFSSSCCSNPSSTSSRTLPTGRKPPDPARAMAPSPPARRNSSPSYHSTAHDRMSQAMCRKAASTPARATKTTKISMHGLPILAPMGLRRDDEWMDVQPIVSAQKIHILRTVLFIDLHADSAGTEFARQALRRGVAGRDRKYEVARAALTRPSHQCAHRFFDIALPTMRLEDRVAQFGTSVLLRELMPLRQLVEIDIAHSFIGSAQGDGAHGPWAVLRAAGQLYETAPGEGGYVCPVRGKPQIKKSGRNGDIAGFCRFQRLLWEEPEFEPPCEDIIVDHARFRAWRIGFAKEPRAAASTSASPSHCAMRRNSGAAASAVRTASIPSSPCDAFTRKRPA